MRILLAFALFHLALFSGPLRSDDGSALRLELEAILALDQTFRAPGNGYRWAEVAAEQEAIDRSNLVRLLELVETHGWPRMSKVGEDAALAAFLVVQHADLEVQERFLPVIRSLVAEGEAKGAWLALLTDRIRVRQGQPQIFGTQSRHNPETGRSEPLPIEDPENVNLRRMELGLKPLSREYAPRGKANDG